MVGNLFSYVELMCSSCDKHFALICRDYKKNLINFSFIHMQQYVVCTHCMIKHKYKSDVNKNEEVVIVIEMKVNFLQLLSSYFVLFLDTVFITLYYFWIQCLYFLSENLERIVLSPFVTSMY
jgi:hypothetical protein